MKRYLVRVSHFSFYKEGDTLIVRSEEHPEFEALFDWKEKYDGCTRKELTRVLYEEYYTELVSGTA
jgi:hypothetical protein